MRGALGLGLGLAGTLLVAAMAVAGAIGGSALADYHNENLQETTGWIENGEGELALIASSGDEGPPVKINFAAKEKAARQAASGRKAWEEAAPETTGSVNPVSAPQHEFMGGDL